MASGIIQSIGKGDYGGGVGYDSQGDGEQGRREF